MHGRAIQIHVYFTLLYPIWTRPPGWPRCVYEDAGVPLSVLGQFDSVPLGDDGKAKHGGFSFSVIIMNK